MVQIYTREMFSPAKRQAPSSDFHLLRFFGELFVFGLI
jgi:hypothetical protein